MLFTWPSELHRRAYLKFLTNTKRTFVLANSKIRTPRELERKLGREIPAIPNFIINAEMPTWAGVMNHTLHKNLSLKNMSTATPEIEMRPFMLLGNATCMES